MEDWKVYRLRRGNVTSAKLSIHLNITFSDTNCIISFVKNIYIQQKHIITEERYKL